MNQPSDYLEQLSPDKLVLNAGPGISREQILGGVEPVCANVEHDMVLLVGPAADRPDRTSDRFIRFLHPEAGA